MKIVEISDLEFASIVKAEPNASFYQTTDYAKCMQIKNYQPVYVKYINNLGNCISLGLFLLKKESIITSRYTAYAPLGFLTNYYDEDELTSFNDELISFLKSKRVNKVVITPNITPNDAVHNSLLKMGYHISDDNYIYKVDVSEYEVEKFDKNLIFKFKQVNEDNTNFDHILLSAENQELYDLLKDSTDLYINQLDSSRSLNNLNGSLKDCEKFIQRHKDDAKYEQKIEQKLEDIKNIKKLISQINKIEKTLGSDPILCLALIYKYNNEYYLLFIDNKDEKEIFNSQRYLISKLLQEAHDKGYQELISKISFAQAEYVNLIGEYTINI